MVIKIADPKKVSLATVLGYNEGKVSQGEATLIGVSGMMYPLEEDGVRRTFEWYLWRNIKSKNVSFHMSVNPDVGEKWNDRKMQRFVADLMAGLGYGDQPYAIYRHNDTERTHYHVVSVRTGKDGKKIPDGMEYTRCYRLAKSLEDKYGYKVGRPDGKRINRFRVEEFNPKAGEVAGQMRTLCEDALQYRFTTFDQFVLVMRVHGIGVKARGGLRQHLVLQGLDQRGKPCTPELTEKELGMQLYALYSRRAMDSVSWLGTPEAAELRESMALRCATALVDSESQRDFRVRLRQNGNHIDCSLRRDERTHRISGGDFVDHGARCAFSLQDLGDGFDLDMIREADEHQWEPERRSYGPGIGDLLAGLSDGSKSKEKDMKDRKRKKGRRI